MTDFSAYFAAQHITRNAVNGWRPDAPVRPDRLPLTRRPGVVAARRWLSLTLRRLADDIQPVPKRAGSPQPASR